MSLPRDKHKDISSARDMYIEAKQAYKNTILHTQSECQHLFVAETPFLSSQYGSPLLARRICHTCGYEEEGSHWSGGNVWRVTPEDTLLGNSSERMIETIDRDSFYNLRN